MVKENTGMPRRASGQNRDPKWREIGARIEERLRTLGWTQRDLAGKISAHEATISKWINGVAPPGRDAVGELAAAMGVPVGWLMGDEVAWEEDERLADRLVILVRRFMEGEDLAAVFDSLTARPQELNSRARRDLQRAEERGMRDTLLSRLADRGWSWSDLQDVEKTRLVQLFVQDYLHRHPAE